MIELEQFLFYILICFFFRIAKFFVNNIGLNFYKRKPEEWKELQNKDFKKRKMFSDLFDDKNAKDSSESNDNENKHKKIKT